MNSDLRNCGLCWYSKFLWCSCLPWSRVLVARCSRKWVETTALGDCRNRPPPPKHMAAQQWVGSRLQHLLESNYNFFFPAQGHHGIPISGNWIQSHSIRIGLARFSAYQKHVLVPSRTPDASPVLVASPNHLQFFGKDNTSLAYSGSAFCLLWIFPILLSRQLFTRHSSSPTSRKTVSTRLLDGLSLVKS